MSVQALLTQYGDKYLQALLTTWRLTAVSFAAAFLIGIVITVLRVCPIRPLRLFGNFYVQIFRNIPGAALLILLVYALPYLQIIFPYEVCVLIATIQDAIEDNHLFYTIQSVLVPEAIPGRFRNDAFSEE